MEEKQTDVSFDIIKYCPPTTYKILIVGDCKVGKTSLFKKALKDQFPNNYDTTFAFEEIYLKAKINSKELNFRIIDMSGNENFINSIAANFFPKTSLAIIVYDITSRESYNHVENWIAILKSTKVENAILVGNKVDLSESQRQVPQEDLQKKCGSPEMIKKCMECSAKNGKNVREIFEEAIRIVYDKEKDNLKENTELVPKQKKKGCCPSCQ